MSDNNGRPEPRVNTRMVCLEESRYSEVPKLPATQPTRQRYLLEFLGLMGNLAPTIRYELRLQGLMGRRNDSRISATNEQWWAIMQWCIFKAKNRIRYRHDIRDVPPTKERVIRRIRGEEAAHELRELGKA